MTTLYTVTRDCHQGPGLCINCESRGGKYRVEHITTPSRSLADQILRDWRAFNPTLTTNPPTTKTEY